LVLVVLVVAVVGKVGTALEETARVVAAGVVVPVSQVAPVVWEDLGLVVRGPAWPAPLAALLAPQAMVALVALAVTTPRMVRAVLVVPQAQPPLQVALVRLLLG
jgi:hypothetical protein